MTRKFAHVNVGIWDDPDFRALPPLAQHLYMVLWTSAGLSYCGSHDWRPGRLAKRAGGWSRADVEAAAACLQARHFLVIDDDSEEVLVRSWVRWDGLLKEPRMAISCVNSYSEVASETLRGVVVHELAKIREQQPDLACWRDRRVLEVLGHPAVSAKDLPTPEDPFGGQVGGGFGVGLAQTLPSVSGSVSTPPTPSPAPTPSLPGLPDADASDATPTGRRKPERPLPESWAPNAKHFAFAEERGVNLQSEARAFRNHAQTHDRRARDWDAAFRTWLDKAKSPRPAGRPGRGPVTDLGGAEWLLR